MGTSLPNPKGYFVWAYVGIVPSSTRRSVLGKAKYHEKNNEPKEARQKLTGKMLLGPKRALQHISKFIRVRVSFSLLLDWFLSYSKLYYFILSIALYVCFNCHFLTLSKKFHHIFRKIKFLLHKSKLHFHEFHSKVPLFIVFNYYESQCTSLACVSSWVHNWVYLIPVHLSTGIHK